MESTNRLKVMSKGNGLGSTTSAILKMPFFSMITWAVSANPCTGFWTPNATKEKGTLISQGMASPIPEFSCKDAEKEEPEKDVVYIQKPWDIKNRAS